MTDYTKTTDFAAKDTLPSGNANKVVKGAEFGTEFDNIATAISTKFDNASTVDISDGNINNTVIGATTPAAATFTTVTASSDVTVDTNVLKVDTANNRVGVGTASPSEELHIKETSTGLSSSPKVLIEGTGGSLTNNAILEFNAGGSTGSITTSSTNSGTMTLTQGSNAGISLNSFLSGLALFTAGTAGSPDIQVDSSGNLKVLTADLICSNDLTVDTNTFHVDATNNRVGVGTTSPSNLLSVVNNGTSTIVSVESTNVSNTTPQIQLKGVSDGSIKMVSGGLGGLQLINDSAGTINLKNVGTLVMTNDNDGSENTMTLKDNTLNIANIPTSSSGLSSGDIWNDSGTLKIVS
jgi:hypothetical protein